MRADLIEVDALAQEIRRVDGNNSLGAGALAEALMPFLADALASQEPVAWRMTYTDPKHGSFVYYDEKPWTDRPNTSIEPLFASPVVPVAAKAEAETIRAQALKECAALAYRICAETRHVISGDKVASAIRARIPAKAEAEGSGKQLWHELADCARRLLDRPPELRGPFKVDEEALRRVAALPPRTRATPTSKGDGQ